MHSITFKGFDFDFDYNYEPYEAQTYEYPGYPAQFEIYNIKLNGIAYLLYTLLAVVRVN